MYRFRIDKLLLILIKISSSQYNYQYGNQIHFPYSVAMLYSYITSKEDLKEKIQFEKTFVLRDKIEEDIKKCISSDILLCSCYVWNWEITTYLAKKVKEINPNCTIIFGGPQVPEDTNGFFEKYSFVDILVHGEGEIILENILKEYLNEKNYFNVKGISTKEIRTHPQERINDLGLIPSPYLTNNIWKLVDKLKDLKWIASWETNRGCPYQCTFCDWGSATFTKLRNFVDDRLFKEIEWFAKNKIIYIDCCDANFGIMQKRDLLLARKLKEMALETGYPEKIRPAWAKNSSEKIIPIAEELKEGNILGAVTLAVQSLDEKTLDIVKRANIKFSVFSELSETFRKHQIPTYTELILGLPGETIDTFKEGLETIAQTRIDTVFIYNCGVLPNAPMNVKSYIEKYKIKKIRSPIMLVHSSIENRGIQEYEDIVTGTYTSTLEDLKEMRFYSWSFLTFQNLGILELISKFYNEKMNLPYMKFYERFLEFCRNSKGIFSDEYLKVSKYIKNGYEGNGWDHFDENLGNIIWPIEEASWLRITYNGKKLHDEITEFLSYLEKNEGYKTNKMVIEELIKFQIFILTLRNQDKIKKCKFHYDWKNFFLEGKFLEEVDKIYTYQNKMIEDDPVQWGYKTIWYGRRSNQFRSSLENLIELENGQILT